MATYSPLLGLSLPTTGTLSGAWGDEINNFITSYLDSAVAGGLAITADKTLTKTTNATLGATSSQYAILLCNPASANITITAPAASKTYAIVNASATYTVKIVGAGPTTGVTLPVSSKALVAWNGTDFVLISASSIAVGSITGLGTGVATALAVNVGSAGAPVVNGGALGTPLSGSAANLTSFPTLNQNTSGYAEALKSATTTVSVSAATAPSTGQVLMATSSIAATWQTPAAGVSAANPTGTIAGAAVNGSASTFMRSDAAPALSLASPPAIGGTTPNTGAFTSVAASSFVGTSATGALNIPTGTTAQRPTPANGMIRMNSDYGRPEYYSSIMGLWIPFSSGGGTPNIGDPFGGGFFAGYIGVSGVATHMLIVAPKASGESTKKWKNTNDATTGADSLIDGPQNTADMVADGNATVYPAAHWANDLSIGGYDDWYLPARNELEVAYYNLKNVSQANYVAGGNLGNNANAVPPGEPVSTNYTATRPAQTNVAAFRVGNTEAFAGNDFWSSTEYSAPYAWAQNFASGAPGYQRNDSKTAAYYVRAFRRLAI